MRTYFRNGLLVVIAILVASADPFWLGPEVVAQEKIRGISMIAPENPVDDSWTQPILEDNAEWVTLIPFAFSQKNQPQVMYKMENQWWGEIPEGLAENTAQAHCKGLNVMYKPQIYVPGSWPGGFNVKNEEEWVQWENEYRNLIIELASLAEEQEVEMFCIGTEYKTAIRKRPEFWHKLIAEVREVYSGKLTYAANWDNYKNIPFWEILDFIGIDAYYPLTMRKTPELPELIRAWRGPRNDLEKFSRQYQKPIIFTEFGYRSRDFAAWQQWTFEHEGTDSKVNLEAQSVAYQALFESFWDEPWWAGGFVWKWFDYHGDTGGMNHSGYTPQNKPAEKVIRHWYSH